MSKLLKKRTAEELTREMEKVDSFIVFDYTKMSAQQSYDLRKRLAQKNIRIKVVKNTMAAIAFSKVYNTSMDSLLKGATAIAYGGESPAEVAKELMEWGKKLDVLTIKGGYIPQKILTKEEVEQLSKIPARPVLLSMLAGSFMGPVQGVAIALKGVLQNMTYALNALIAQKEENQSES